MVRRSPRSWWFYFWLVSLPILLLVFFLQPLIIDPLFHQFEPLAKKDPALVASLEQMVQRAGENIPPERMFWMGASEKSTAVNAYVTGFGSSKRVVGVGYDDRKNDHTTDRLCRRSRNGSLGPLPHSQIACLWRVRSAHIPLFAYRFIGWIVSRWGPKWEIRGVDDWASLPVLLLLLSIFAFAGNPVSNAFNRHYEHQADQYGLEVTHGLTPDSGQVAAQTFQTLGDVDLADPEPSPVNVFPFYSHPPIADLTTCRKPDAANGSSAIGCPGRIGFALTYDPWSNSGHGEFVH